MRDDSSPVGEIDFVDDDIDNKHQLLLILTDSNKLADDVSGNYCFTCSVDFTRDSVHKITMKEIYISLCPKFILCSG